MVTQIQFLKMPRSEAIEQYVTDELEFLQGHIPHQKEAHFRVWLKCLNSQAEPGRDEFRCAIEIDGLSKKRFYVEKKDENFYKAFHICIDALDKVFRREKRVMISEKKKGGVRALVFTTAS